MTVLDWKDESGWLGAMDAYASEVLDVTVREHVLRGRSYCDSDNLQWLPNQALFRSFLDAFVSHYKSVRAFHGCRPLDVRSYTRDGFTGHVTNRLKHEFSLRFPEIPADVLNLASKDLDESRASEENKTWFVLTERELIEKCGSYIIHGSEYLAALAGNVSHRVHDKDYLTLLQNTGYPTIIEVELPVSHLSSPQLHAIAREILSAWGARITKRSSALVATPCVSIARPLEARYIVGHTHPKEVRDPYRMQRRAMSPTTCPECHASEA